MDALLASGEGVGPCRLLTGLGLLGATVMFMDSSKPGQKQKSPHCGL